MRNNVLLILLLVGNYVSGQNLITNGSFEATPSFSNWTVSAGGSNLWYGTGSCVAPAGVRYSFSGDQLQSSGVNNLLEEAYQIVSIPSNASVCSLTFSANISTLDGTTNAYDSLIVGFQNLSGVRLQSWSLSNMNATSTTIPGCGSWVAYGVQLSSALHGQTLRFFIRHMTDVTLPTIFRVDNFQLVATTPSCTYSLSANSYSFSSSGASTNVVSNVIAPPGCNWNANVTSGSSWLSSTSNGSGNGQITASVTANTSPNARTGTINIAGQTLTIVQPGLNCTYILSTNAFLCPSSSSNNHTAASVIAPPGCSWTAIVSSGQGWLSTTSSGTGNGSVIIQVTSNLTTSSRTGAIDVNGQILTVTQPGTSCTYALTVTNFNCPNNLANTYSGIVNVNTLNGCQWTAIVTSGSSWLSTNSNGNGPGPLSFSVLGNSSGSPRTGIINVNGSEISITQPAAGVGIREINTLSIFNVYPNPTDGLTSVYLETLLDQDYNLEIFDVLGRQIYQSSISSQVGVPFKAEVDLSLYVKGVYFFRLSNSKSESLSKRIVLR